MDEEELLILAMQKIHRRRKKNPNYGSSKRKQVFVSTYVPDDYAERQIAAALSENSALEMEH